MTHKRKQTVPKLFSKSSNFYWSLGGLEFSRSAHKERRDLFTEKKDMVSGQDCEGSSHFCIITKQLNELSSSKFIIIIIITITIVSSKMKRQTSFCNYRHSDRELQTILGSSTQANHPHQHTLQLQVMKAE